MTLSEFILGQIAFHEDQAAEHRRGQMMSLTESVHGEAFHRDEAKRLRKILVDLTLDNKSTRS